MLKKGHNDLLTQTGPGTPMGELFRRYWTLRYSPKNCPKTIARRLEQSFCRNGCWRFATPGAARVWIDEFVKRNWKPVEDHLRGQGRYAHLFEPVRKDDIIHTIQREVDQYWRAYSAD